MRIKKHIPTLIALTAVLTLGVSLYVNINKAPAETDATQVNENFAPYTYSGSYYSGINFSASEGMDGTLRSDLTSLIRPKGFVDYSSGLSTHCQQADEDQNNKNNMILFYTRDSVKKQGAGTWNREHVWPKALSNGNWGTSKGGTDILHLRPTYVKPNSTRSSHPFGNATGGNTLVYEGMTYGKLAGDIFEPLDCVKGDVARIIMYMWTAYRGYSGYSELRITDVFSDYNTLIEWHTMDKPDALEGHRNDYVQTTIQKNRNPFVDHPELGWKIFGNNVSNSVKSACMAAYPANGGTPIDPTGLSLNKETATVQVGKTTQLNASLEPYGASGTITWSSNNTAVATVSNGTVTGKSVGEAVITATCGSFSDSCTVTVSEAVNIYGTLEDPLTVSEARQLIDDGNTSEKMYVKGIVSSSKYNSQYDNFDNVWLKNEDGDEDQYFDLYHTNMQGSTENYRSDDALKDKEVVAYGYGKKYNSTYELAPNGNDKPVILSVTDPSAPEKTPREIIEATETATTLSYRYTKESSGSASVTDALDREFTGRPNSTDYKEWTATGTSGISYAGQSAGGYDSIQLRSSNSNSGIVVTSNPNGANASSITVVWDSNTSGGRTLNIYGKNTAYTAPTDLYGNNAGTLLGTIVKGTSTSFTITGDYEYIGLRSNNSAMYLDEINIQWGGSAATYEYSDVSIRFGGLLTQDLWDELDTEDHLISGFGVMITEKDVVGNSTIKELNELAIPAEEDPDVTEEIVNYYMPKEKMATPVEDDDNYYWNLFFRITDLKTTYVSSAYIQVGEERIFFKQAKYSAKTLAADYIANRGCGPTTANGSLANLASL